VSPSALQKYPRTPHLPWSPGASADDVRAASARGLVGREVVATEKLDGENTTLYAGGHSHARSVDSAHHPSRTWVKALAARIGHDIPTGWRLCGENLYARHSLAYDDLEGYFALFSVWDEQNTCLSWRDTMEWATLLELPTPRVLYAGPYDEATLRRITDGLDLSRQEGVVVRLAEAFPYAAFGDSVLKWVRPNHVQTDEHWAHQAIIPNRLRGAP